MINGFWEGVKKRAGTEPFFVMAPLADVTDVAFREIIAKYSRMGKKGGGPAVLWTEFVSADGLCSPGRKVLERDLAYTEGQRLIVAQLFTGHPKKMREACALARELGFDGIDINMGCPDKSIEKQCAGASMMKDPELARKVIESAREGAGDIPVSVKTRIGYNKNEITTWIAFLLELKLPVLTVHLRTRKEMSDVPAHWELMPEIIALRDKISPDTLIIGNGDALSLDDGRQKAQASGADGVMFGRAIFGNPWLFDTQKKEVTMRERLEVMLEHTLLYEKLLGDIKNFAIMKKHYKAYVNGWDGAKELRAKLMETNSGEEVEKIVKEYLKSK
jgi:nifR3 family TIM-barrel protein